MNAFNLIWLMRSEMLLIKLRLNRVKAACRLHFDYSYAIQRELPRTWGADPTQYAYYVIRENCWSMDASLWYLERGNSSPR
jgi:hypothetical protein